MTILYLFLLCMMQVSGQGSQEKLIAQNWSEGNLNEINDAVINLKKSRGGVMKIFISQDGTIKFSHPFSCGFGSYKTGVWELNSDTQELTMHFHKHEGFLNNPVDKEIDERHTYAIIKLTTSELIIQEQVKNATIIGFLIAPN